MNKGTQANWTTQKNRYTPRNAHPARPNHEGAGEPTDHPGQGPESLPRRPPTHTGQPRASWLPRRVLPFPQRRLSASPSYILPEPGQGGGSPLALYGVSATSPPKPDWAATTPERLTSPTVVRAKVLNELGANQIRKPRGYIRKLSRGQVGLVPGHGAGPHLQTHQRGPRRVGNMEIMRRLGRCGEASECPTPFRDKTAPRTGTRRSEVHVTRSTDDEPASKGWRPLLRDQQELGPHFPPPPRGDPAREARRERASPREAARSETVSGCRRHAHGHGKSRTPATPARWDSSTHPVKHQNTTPADDETPGEERNNPIRHGIKNGNEQGEKNRQVGPRQTRSCTEKERSGRAASGAGERAPGPCPSWAGKTQQLWGTLTTQQRCNPGQNVGRGTSKHLSESPTDGQQAREKMPSVPCRQGDADLPQ